jgi:hypothetical protein
MMRFNRGYSVSDPPKDEFAVANKTERVLDFGYCLLRMNVGAEQQ